MKKIRVLLAGLAPAARAAARAGATTAFPGAEIIETGGVQEAAAHATNGTPCLLVTGSPLPESSPALKPSSGAGQPNWAPVLLGDDPSGFAEAIPAAGWNAPALSRIFRHAVTQHELQRENARLLGDLKTIARRISHDLRSPVGSIHTSAEVLMELSADDAATITSMAEIMRQSSGEISQIVDRVSFLAWASAHPSPSVKIDLAEMLSHVLAQLGTEIDSAHATVALPSAWPETFGVVSWTQTIWTNLLANALRHGGRAPQIVIGWTADPAGFRFTVTDNGPGVAAARIAGLFTPFDQLHTGRVPGLGLAIVQRLVALQGGHCGHVRPPEGGARFYFTLPAVS